MTVETVSLNRSQGGVQGVYRHASRETKTPMTFSVYVPAHQAGVKLPVVWYLSGLTCTHANVTEEGEFRKACADLGLVLGAPDTSPRGEDVPTDPARAHDSVALSEDGASFSDLLVDYGDADQFLIEQLRPELLERACSQAAIPLLLRRQAGYDHSYYFISTFMEDHLRWHAVRLAA